jgi:hypothetical protein
MNFLCVLFDFYFEENLIHQFFDELGLILHRKINSYFLIENKEII